MANPKYCILECNRKSENKNIKEDDDIYKNSWSNNISTYGLEIKKGDLIQLESASINTKGSIDEAIEFLGNDENLDSSTPIDNKVEIVNAFYINHTGQFSIRLPFLNSKTYTNYSDPSTIPPQNIKFNNHLFCRNRGLGEYDITDYNRVTATNYSNIQTMPTNHYLPQYFITESGAGYKIGDTCTIDDVQGGSGSGFSIKITDIEDQGTIQGAITRFQLKDIGNLQYTTSTDLNINPPVSGRPGFVQAKLKIGQEVNENFSEIFKSGADGERYFPALPGYTGIALQNYTGSDNNDTAPFNDMESLQPYFTERVVNNKLEIEPGLHNPDNISETLTKQLKDPEFFNDVLKPNNEYLNYKDLRVLDRSFSYVQPPLLETPTYQPMACNFDPTTQIKQSHSLAGSRRLFYSNIAYRDVEKIQSLQAFRQMKFHNENEGIINDINTGMDQQICGDFNNQLTGNLGIHTCLMVNLPFVNNQVGIVRNDLIITNLYFKEDTLKKLEGAFRRFERYTGDKNLNSNIQSENYKNNLSICLDIGYYCDERSNGELLTNSSTNLIFANQRQRFLNATEAITDGTNSILQPVDSSPCYGTQDDRFFEGNFENDSQQLSQIMIRSRYNNEITIDNDETPFNKAYTLLLPSADRMDTNKMFHTNSTDFKEVFRGNNYENLISLAKKYNIACVPVYATEQDEFNKGLPYIAFISALTTTQSVTLPPPKFNPDTHENWCIDGHNCTYGMPLGYDVSFIRNKAVSIFNPKTGQPPDSDQFSGPSSYCSGLFMGASDISIDFNLDFDRFTFSKLSTPMTIGQGTLRDFEYGNGIIKDASDNPEQIVYNNNLVGQYPNMILKTINCNPALVSETTSAGGWLLTQKRNSFIDSYSGLAIIAVSLFYKNGVKISYNNYDSNNDEEQIRNSLLGKLGFKFEDLLPLQGNSQGRQIELYNQNITQTYKQIQKQCMPVTTNLYISSSEYQASASNVLDQPTFDLSINCANQSRPEAQPSLLLASNLPQKLDYPYLVVYSSLPSHGTDTEYYGGKNSHQKIPAMSYVTRYNNEGNFFYGLESTFTYTSTKDFVLSDIDTRILLPDGSKPRLSENSGVIYKITKFPQIVEIEKPKKK